MNARLRKHAHDLRDLRGHVHEAQHQLRQARAILERLIPETDAGTGQTLLDDIHAAERLLDRYPTAVDGIGYALARRG